MKRLLDTTVLVDLLRGNEDVRRRLEAEDPADLAISTVTVSELMTGATLAADTHRELFAVELAIRPLRQLPLDGPSARRAGLIKALLDRKGASIGVADRLIAATALEHDAVVVTSNAREFARVPSLITEDWRAPA